MMKKTFEMTRHLQICAYLYGGHFVSRTPIADGDVAAMAGMWHLPVLDFDLTALKGSRIVSAVLHLQAVNAPPCLEMELTTVSQQWNREHATYYTCDSGKPWAGGGVASDVLLGRGNSRCFRERTDYDAGTGMLRVNVEPSIVYAMANGQSFGVGLLDAKSRPYATSESDKWAFEDWLAVKKINVNAQKGPLPWLEVEYSTLSAGAPPAVSELEGVGVIDGESFEHAGAVLGWKVNGQGSGEYRFYRIFLSELDSPAGSRVEAERYEVPIYDAGRTCQTAELSLLKPCTAYRVEVVAANACAESDSVSAVIRTPAAQQPPPEPACAPVARGACPPRVSAEGFAVYAVDDISKVNPVTGNLLEQSAEGFETEGPCGIDRYSNTLYDSHGLGLTCAPGERLGFQLIVKNETDNATDFEAAVIGGAPGGIRVSFNRVWYIRSPGGWFPEVAVPMGPSGRFSVPFRENAIPRQRFQSLFVDVEVPPNVKPGRYNLSIRISAGCGSAAVPVRLEVEPLALDEPDFVFDLNGYASVPEYMGSRYGDPGFARIEQAYYREAWRHGLAINIVPYDQRGRMQAGFAPQVGIVDGALRVTDWSQWDERFGKFLDGSYLLETEGRRVPIKHMYIPIHENWPLAIADYYTPQTGVTEYPEIVNDLKLKTTTVAGDFKPGYREGILEVFKDFIRHSDEKGWGGVTFQFYLNNKNFYKENRFMQARSMTADSHWLVDKTIGDAGEGSSWWLLDEPNFRDDFDALAYFGGMLRDAKAELGSGRNFRFRLDISGYNYMSPCLDGLVGIPVINSRGYAVCERTARRRNVRFGESGWIYGCFNNVDSSNMDSFLWAFSCYMRGANGVVPWYNYATDDEYDHPSQTACLYPGNRFGLEGPAVSLRLKAARKCMEIIKYVETFRRVYGYTGLQMRAYVSRFLETQAQTVSRFRDDAGMEQFSRGNSIGAIERLKTDLARKLAARLG